MATANKKVSGYLKPALFELFEKYRTDRQLTASQAVCEILENFLSPDARGLSVKEVKPALDKDSMLHLRQIVQEELAFISNSLNWTVQEVHQTLNEVQQRLNRVENQFLGVQSNQVEHHQSDTTEYVIHSDFPGGSADAAKGSQITAAQPLNEKADSGSLPVDYQVDQKGDGNHSSEIAASGSLPVDYQVDQNTALQPNKETLTNLSSGLTGKDLARRLGCNPGTLVKNRDRQDFIAWTALKDPDGLAWEWGMDKKKYFVKP